MSKVFNFQENKSYNLRSGIHLDTRNMHNAHFGTETIVSLGPKLWKPIPDKIKHASTLSAFVAKIKSWTISNYLVDLVKYLLRILVLLKFALVSVGIPTNA